MPPTAEFEPAPVCVTTDALIRSGTPFPTYYIIYTYWFCYNIIVIAYTNLGYTLAAAVDHYMAAMWVLAKS